MDKNIYVNKLNYPLKPDIAHPFQWGIPAQLKLESKHS
jgi:hypothetical protein